MKNLCLAMSEKVKFMQLKYYDFVSSLISSICDFTPKSIQFHIGKKKYKIEPSRLTSKGIESLPQTLIF